MSKMEPVTTYDLTDLNGDDLQVLDTALCNFIDANQGSVYLKTAKDLLAEVLKAKSGELLR